MRATRSLFGPVAPEGRISRRFRDVRDQKAFTAARRLMDDIFPDFPDVDHSSGVSDQGVFASCAGTGLVRIPARAGIPTRSKQAST